MITKPNINYCSDKFILNIALIISLIALTAIAIIFRQSLLLLLLNAFVVGAFYFIIGYLIKRRERQIAKLSEYLRNVIAGNNAFDLRDYEEGEISALKAEIYKVTNILMLQNEMLLHDKKQLADQLSNISHQLKTPLTSVGLMSELLANADDSNRDKINSILSVEIKRMNWLVQTLLKLSRFDADAVELKIEENNLSELIKNALSPFSIQLDVRNITAEIEINEKITINADCSWFSEAISNIMKNAFQYINENGKIEIKADDNPLFTRIIISDNGIGIPKDEIRYVFDRFHIGKNAENESTGIGLALTESIIKKHGGVISVSSGNGTKFEITLYKVLQNSHQK